jgi:signal transduction histidine kinase/FixJ family two-component response regulator
MSIPIFRFKVLPIDPEEKRMGRHGILLPGDHQAWLPFERCGANDGERGEFIKRLKEGASNIYVKKVKEENIGPNTVVWEVEPSGEEPAEIDKKFIEWEEQLNQCRDESETCLPPIVSMIVTSIFKKMIYGQIAPGIEGYFEDFTTSSAYLSRWQPKALSNNAEFGEISAGDCIAGFITRLDRGKRQVQMDPLKLITCVDADPSMSFQILDLSKEVPKTSREKRTGRKKDPYGIECVSKAMPFSSVFLLDDDRDLAGSIRQMLKDAAREKDGSVEVFMLNSFDDAKRRIKEKDVAKCDCAIIDVSLVPQAQEMNTQGLDIVREMQKIPLNCSYLLMTGISPLDCIVDLLPHDGKGPLIHGILLKPFTPGEFFQKLHEISKCPAMMLKDYIANQNRSAEGSDIGHAADQTEKLEQSIQQIVSQLREKTNADSCYLFEMNPMKLNQGRIYARDAFPSDLFLSQSSRYQYSPISDVALRREILDYGHDPLAHEEKHSWLLKMHPCYGWCLGIPVPTKGAKRYALFLFRHVVNDDSQPSVKRRLDLRKERSIASFGASDFARSCKAAGDIGILLTSDAYEDILYRERLLSKHAIANAFYVHQIKSSITALNLEMPEFDKVISNADSTAEQMASEIMPHLKIMKSALNEAKNMEDRIRAEHSQQRKGKILLAEILDRACQYAGSYLNMKNVDLVTDYANMKSLYVDLSHREITQVFYNLMANAAELHELFFSREQIIERWRRGVVRLLYIPEEVPGSKGMARIVVADNGPGIPFHHWDVIWEAGVTMKTEGTGLGLAFARRVISDCKGRLFIRQSVLFFGTAFEVWLPLYQR